MHYLLSSVFPVSEKARKKTAEFERGNIINDYPISETEHDNGTLTEFIPDDTIFKDYHYLNEHIEPLLKNYVFLNTGLSIIFNGKKFHSKNGLVDLLNENMTTDPLYPIIHLSGR